MNRKEQINRIISDLENMREKVPQEESYALEENIVFFRAIYSFYDYILWLISRARKIDKERLLELTDFPFPEWQRELHICLAEMEKKPFPGMITPLRDAIVNYIYENDPEILMDLGYGSMEVERQYLSILKEKGYSRKLIIIGIDLSPLVAELAIKNLEELGSFINIVKASTVSFSDILKFKNKDKHTLILAQNNIFDLGHCFSDSQIDLIYYSKFKHHLTKNQREDLDHVVSSLGKNVIEYDDIYSFLNLLLPSLGAWKYPVLLNGAIFSRLRDPNRETLRSSEGNGWSVKFFRNGSYLRSL